MNALEIKGETYNGFLIVKRLPLKELQSTLIEAVHEESGARIMQIANDDPENLFSLSFQTLPDSSNGVAHILEHTVLCGSKRYPIKDPFFAMGRRSLNTYMNALTGSDFTCYPASSQVEKDFYNLLEVYLDAVFHPQLKFLSFLQEGHRLAFSESGNSKSPLEIQGVVYNEMKGAMSGSDARLWAHLFKALTPDLPYSYNSGGDPKEIPNLSYEELVEFHRTFYHPSRCLFFFYGNLPLARHLDFIKERALTGIEKVPLLPPLPLQTRTTPKIVVESYPIASNEDPANKTIVALGVLTAPISDQTDQLALNLIDSLLTDTDVSPLRLALLKSGLCTIVDSSLDLEMSEAPWVLICKGTHPDAGQKILKLVRSTLEDLCKQGFDKEAIEASLHQLEFQRTEIGGEGVPFGLSLFFRAALSKQHGAEPEQALLIHSLFKNLRKKISDPTYLPLLIQHYFLDNPQSVLLTMIPDQNLDEKEREEEKHRLKEIHSHLSEKQIATILEQEQQLSLYQNEVEHQSLECLPTITLKDVPPHAKNYSLDITTKDGMKIFYHSCFTNQILYADLAFDLPALSLEDLTLLPFLARCWTEISSGGRTVAETLELQQASVGELISLINLFVVDGDPHRCLPAISLRAKALNRKIPILMELFRDCALSANFCDETRIKELLLEHTTDLQNRLPKQAMSYAVQLALSGSSLPSALQNHLQGLPYFQTALSWNKSFDLDALDRLYHNLLGTVPSLILSCHEEERHHLESHLSKLTSLPRKNLPLWDTSLIPCSPVPSQGRIIAAPVAYNVLAFSTNELHSPALMVATDLLENIVLHNEIREKGGAYGSGATYAPITGQFYFTSYRDPNISRTYASILKAIDRIAAGKFNDRELEEAKLGILQDFDAPLPPGQRATAAYGWYRIGRTYQKRDAYRRAILDVSKHEVSEAIKTHLASRKEQGTFVSFAGKDLLKKEAKKLPFSLELFAIDER